MAVAPAANAADFHPFPTIRMNRRSPALLLLILLPILFAACAGLGSLAAAIQPPTFRVAEGREAEIRLLGPSTQHPLGGAAVRLWADVTNPNPFGIVLNSLEGTLVLEDTRAATIDFPWGMPLIGGQDTIIPLDVAISFADLPGLGNVLPRAVTGGSVDYSLDGTVTVDAGLLGRPSFGPMNLLRGAIRTRR